MNMRSAVQIAKIDPVAALIPMWGKVWGWQSLFVEFLYNYRSLA